MWIPPPNPPKQKEEQMENSSPNPSFSICNFRIQQQISRSFGKSFPQKNSFAKTSSALFRHLPEYLEGRTPKEKRPFLKNFTPAKSRKQGVFFFRGCRGSARQWRNDTSVRGSLEPPRAPRVRLVLSFKKSSSKWYNDTTSKKDSVTSN